MAQPAGKDGKLSGRQADAIIALLREGAKYSPAQAATYTLAREVWSLAETAPSPEDIVFLSEGDRLFPRSK